MQWMISEKIVAPCLRNRENRIRNWAPEPQNSPMVEGASVSPIEISPDSFRDLVNANNYASFDADRLTEFGISGDQTWDAMTFQAKLHAPVTPPYNLLHLCFSAWYASATWGQNVSKTLKYQAHMSSKVGETSKSKIVNGISQWRSHVHLRLINSTWYIDFNWSFILTSWVNCWRMLIVFFVSFFSSETRSVIYSYWSCINTPYTNKIMYWLNEVTSGCQIKRY